MAHLITMYGRKALENKDILNDFYSEVFDKREESVTLSMTLVERLLSFGLNHLKVDYYFAILACVHSFSLNRLDFQEAS